MSDQAAASTLTLDIERKDLEVLVRLHGRLIAEVSGNFYARIQQLIPGHTRIVLDLTDLSHMDSMGLGSLVRIYASAKSKGCRLELVNLSKGIRHLLGVTHLLSVFTVLGEQGISIGF